MLMMFQTKYISRIRSNPITSQRRPDQTRWLSTQARIAGIADDHDKLYQNIVPKIGLEVHAQLNIKSKLFSHGANVNESPPNSQLDLLDIATPGSLPKLNYEAIRSSILTSLGLNCTIQSSIHFDRKNYFYTDMPAGYQITQYHNPISKNGFIDFAVYPYHKSPFTHQDHYDLIKHVYAEDRFKGIEFLSYMKRSKIKQVQLEQDSAKSLLKTTRDPHETSSSWIDYSRSGAALMEIVFEPDIENHHEASSLIRELIIIFKALDTCTCELQNGTLRVDANVSIGELDGKKIHGSNRVELKNLNSLRALNRGILSEIHRQAKLIRNGKAVIQDTRTFDWQTNQTVPLREKESAADYRYVPEPNIPPLRIGENLIEAARGGLPSRMPSDSRNELMHDLNLDLSLVADIMDEPGLDLYFIEINRNRNYDVNAIAEFLQYVFANLELATRSRVTTERLEEKLSPDKMRAIMDRVHQDEISFNSAFEVIKYIFVSTDELDPNTVIERLDCHQINDEVAIEEMCTTLIKGMKNVSKKYRKTGGAIQMRLMIKKLLELSNNKVNVASCIRILNKLLDR